MGTAADKVYIVEDDRSVRDALRALVESEGFNAQIFDNAEDVRTAPPSTWEDAGGACVLLDVRLPGGGGLKLLEQLVREHAGLPVVLISAHTDVPLAVAAMKQGAVDVIEKPFSGERVLSSVRDAVALHHARRNVQARTQSIQQRHASLSPREKQVMVFVVGGMLNKQIAQDLHLSTKTVECHRARVMEKMGAESLAELVRMAVTLEEVGLMRNQSSLSRSTAV